MDRFQLQFIAFVSIRRKKNKTTKMTLFNLELLSAGRYEDFKFFLRDI